MYHTIIIGGGPAALQAALSLSSENVKTLLIERGDIGGQIAQSPMFENFVAAQCGLTGPKFADDMREQAVKFGVVFHRADVRSLSRSRGGDSGPWTYTVGCGEDHPAVQAHTVIIATGKKWQFLDTPGVLEGVGAGLVHYGPRRCVDLDCKGKGVAVFGGGASAGQAILKLTENAKRTHVILRSDLRMPQYLLDRISRNLEVGGSMSLHRKHDLVRVSVRPDHLLDVVIRPNDDPDALPSTLEVSQLFLCAGLRANTAFLPEGIDRADDGGVLVGQKHSRQPLESSWDGVFAIGDCRHGSIPRVPAAIGDGAHVASQVWELLDRRGLLE